MSRLVYQRNHLGMLKLHAVAPEVVEQVTHQVWDDAKRFCPVDTGELVSSIDKHTEGLYGVVTVATDHWVYPEYGTKIQAAQPYMRPALYKQRELHGVKM